MRTYTTEQQTVLSLCSISLEDFDARWNANPVASFDEVIETYKANQ